LKRLTAGILASATIISACLSCPSLFLPSALAAPSDPLDSPRLVLKHGGLFLVVDTEGLMGSPDLPFGLYKDDTRYLAGLNLKINGEPPTLLESNTSEGFGGHFIYSDAAKTVMVTRDLVIDDGLIERLEVQNFAPQHKEVNLTLGYDFDFKDMFEVRGAVKGRKKGDLSITLENTKAVLATYKGRDGKTMQIKLTFLNTEPATVDNQSAQFKFRLKAHERKTIEILAAPQGLETPAASYEQARTHCQADYEAFCKSIATVETDNEEINKVFEQSRRDLFLLQQKVPGQIGSQENAIAAGLPWYAVPFGRDQIITALETIIFAPQLSKQVFEFLAAHQGKKFDKYTEEAPGRIMHELRSGELARNREIPFVPYYGTVDATPLWLVLLSRYCDRSQNIALARQYWPQVELAIDYLKKNTPDTFLKYGGGGALTNQAWKDSGDSVMHQDGSLAEQPIAIAEVQGYLYEAWTGTARLARQINTQTNSKVSEAWIKDLEQRAARLKSEFNNKFSWPEEKYIVLALDGEGKQCRVVASNPGHLLNSGILEPEAAAQVAARLAKEDMFSGFGLRTLATTANAYNPMSYHNGSVWPHDNAMIVSGLVGIDQNLANRIASALFGVAAATNDHRLPELFCGFPKGDRLLPVPYPVSCSPQAWCTASPYAMLSSLLGISVTQSSQNEKGGIKIAHSILPDAINSVTVSNLEMAGSRVTLKVRREISSGSKNSSSIVTEISQ
jgi:glycogen debranching enzyme